MKKLDLTGKTFGNYKVLNIAETRNGKRMWKCECLLCGNIRYVSTNGLTSGRQKSCGCQSYKGEHNGQYSHGLSNHKLNSLWRGIKTRCYNQKSKSYKYYGAKGISMCDEWKNDFKTFYNWCIANGYDENLTIERIDYKGNYEPNNCKFISIQEQQRNKRNNISITHNGETRCLAEWCKILNLNYDRTISRIRNGWSIEDAFTTGKYSTKHSKQA